MDKFEDQISKMKHLMSFKSVNESNSVGYKKIDHMDTGADGKKYAIIRENTKFVIKESSMDNPVSAEDFEYIGGFNNRKNNSFDSYSLALKQFDLKLRAINEKYARKNVVVESFNPEFYLENAVKSTEEMKKEIIRQRQIMENASRIGINENKIDMFKYQDYKHEVPYAPKKSNGVASANGDPFNNTVADNNLNKSTTQAKNHEMEGDPFEEEVVGDNQADELELTNKEADEVGQHEKPNFLPKNSVANEKPKNDMKPVTYDQDKINEGFGLGMGKPGISNGILGKMGDCPLKDAIMNTESTDDDSMEDDNTQLDDDSMENNNLDKVISDLKKALKTLETLNPNQEDYDTDDFDDNTDDFDDNTDDFEIDDQDTTIHEDFDYDDEYDDDYDDTIHADEFEKYGVQDVDDEKFDEPYKFDQEDNDDNMAFKIPSMVKYVSDDKPNLKNRIFSYVGPGKKGSNKSYIMNPDDTDEEYLVPTKYLKLVKESKNNKKTNEDKISDYGNHPEYGKEAMDISGDDKKNIYGKKIGDGDPFDIKLIVDGVMKELKRMNIVKESIPEKKK